MFDFILNCKKPLTILLGANYIEISNHKQKILSTDIAKSFNIDYYLTNNASNIYHAKINFIDGEFVCDEQNVRLIKIKDNTYILNFLLKNECFLQKKSKKIVKNGLIFNFYTNGMVEVETENELKYCNKFDFEIIDAEVVTLKNDFIALKFFGKNDSEYSVVFNNHFAEIISFDSAVLEQTENGFKVLTNLYDIAGHGLVECFEIDEDIKKTDEYSVYLNKAPKRDFNEQVLPIYFLQCIRARDFVEAKRCLSPNLQAKAKMEHLSQFFGDFINIYPINDKIYCEYIDAFDKHFAKPFTFQISNGKIQNIN